MSIIKTIIIDDEENARAYLKQLLTMYCPEVTIAAEASDVSTGLLAIEKHQPQLVFLDIEMPRENGFELLRKLPSIHFEVVFVTAYEKYAIKAFKLSALDYLLKPIDLDDLQSVVRKAVEKIESKEIHQNRYKVFSENFANHKNPFNRISIPILNGFEFVPINDIIYLKAESNYTHFYLKEGKQIVATKTLKDFEDMLTDLNFFRVHKSSIINLAMMVKYTKGDGGMVLLKEGHEVEVSRRIKDSFIEKLNTLLHE